MGRVPEITGNHPRSVPAVVSLMYRKALHKFLLRVHSAHYLFFNAKGESHAVDRLDDL